VAAQIALYAWAAVGAAQAVRRLPLERLAALHPVVASTVAASVADKVD
jgi:hypothetical protein